MCARTHVYVWVCAHVGAGTELSSPTGTALNAIYVDPNSIMEIESVLEPRLALNSPIPGWP